ncbi:MAG: hypothetical protein V3U87_04300 [Methylococcaceae bacterium]
MPAHKWNDAAAVELYKMIKRIKDALKGWNGLSHYQALSLQIVYQLQ